MKRISLITLVALGACQSTASPPRPTAVVASPAPAAAPSGERVWLRTDGQRASSSPALLRAFNNDKEACIGDADYVSAAAEGCMNKRGYIFVAQERAPQMAAELAAKRAAGR